MCLTAQPASKNDKVTYEPPAIVYEGEISTRSGSVPTIEAPPIDPGLDLFTDD